MPRISPPRPTIDPLFGRLLDLAAPVAAALRARLEVLARAGWSRTVEFVESGDANRLAAATVRRLRTALRWAREHDTVPRGTVEQAQQRYEERLVHAERRRDQRERWRQEKDAVRKEREQRYSEKSSIYLG